MQLRTARLCLDCEEIHDSQQCPSCASETFTYLTRWVPVPDVPQSRPRPTDAASPETLDTYRELLSPQEKRGSAWRTLQRGVLGLAIVGVAGWLWRWNARGDAGGDRTKEDDERTSRRQ